VLGSQQIGRRMIGGAVLLCATHQGLFRTDRVVACDSDRAGASERDRVTDADRRLPYFRCSGRLQQLES
jgi:hypothetical protein